MYRIRRLTGGEVTLASLDELAAAVAAGTVTSEAEIHHQRADRWLPIASHPHFKLASERAGSMPRPSPKTAPAPSPAPAQPTLRLVRTDMTAAPPAALEARPTSRWTPPQRSSAPASAARPSGSAAPAMERQSEVIEFVAEPPAAEVPATEPVRPKRIEPATAGLPMLDVEMPQPSRPGRAPTPMPAPISWPAMHAKPRSEPATAKEPVAVAPVADVVPEPVRAPVASAPAHEIAVPEPVAIAIAPESRPAPTVAWQTAETSLDVPPPIDDFSVVPDSYEPASEPEPMLTPLEFSTTPKSRWPMYVGAVAVLGAMAFFAMRPRADVESLAPKPAAAPMAVRPSSPPSVLDAGAQRPQITPDVPPGPSPDVATASPEAAPVVRPAPKFSAAVPEAAVGNLDLQMDPTAASRQKALEETRRDIESQMQR